MKTETKEQLRNDFKTVIKLTFALAYWLVFGIFISIIWSIDGAGLGITLLIMSSVTYLFIIKMTKFIFKKYQRVG
jgi:hypothetical protein